MKTTYNNKKTGIIASIGIFSSILVLSGLSTSAFSNPLESLADQWYVGGSLGLSSINPDGGNTWKTSDDSDIAKKLYVGTDISRQFGLEAFWADFGKAKMKSKVNSDTGKIGYTALGANVIYNSPMKFYGLRPLAKVGVAKFSNKDSGAVKSHQNNKLTVFGGVGAEFDLTENLTLRSEYEYYDKDISQLNVGVNWSPRYRDHSFIYQQNQIKKPVEKKPPIINVYVPPQPRVKPQPIIVQPPKPRVVYKPAPAPAPQKPLYKIIHKTLSGGSHFDSGSATLTLDGRNALDRFAHDLIQQNIKSIRVVGHTDSIGSDQSNLSLSYARANSVAAYLASRGVNRQLINTQGLGESQPIADNRTPQGRALNRRVEITVKSAARIRIR